MLLDKINVSKCLELDIMWSICSFFPREILLSIFSCFRQNLNSDFTDSALGSSEKSPLPYGNFQLRESTVQSILSHPRYGPKYESKPKIVADTHHHYTKERLLNLFYIELHFNKYTNDFRRFSYNPIRCSIFF